MVIGWEGDVDAARGLQVGGRQFFGFVVSFGTPGYVVGVAKGIDIEDVDVSWGEEEVLDELLNVNR